MDFFDEFKEKNNDLKNKSYSESDFELAQDKKLVFEAFHGGYFGPSYYYYIRKDINTNEYEFKYGYSKFGAIIQENEIGENIRIILRTEREYKDFINELFEIVKNWEKNYFDYNIMDGTQWNIDIFENDMKYCGSNSFPNDYGIAMKIINKYFSGFDK